MKKTKSRFACIDYQLVIYWIALSNFVDRITALLLKQMVLRAGVSDVSGSSNYVVQHDWSRIMMSDGSLSRSENGNFLAYRYKLVWHRIDGVFRELR